MLSNTVLVSAVQKVNQLYDTYITSFLDFLPICHHSTEFSVLHTRLSLVLSVSYIVVYYVSISTSQFIPPSLPYLVFINLFSTPVCFCLADKFICTILLDSTYVLTSFAVSSFLHSHHVALHKMR